MFPTLIRYLGPWPLALGPWTLGLDLGPWVESCYGQSSILNFWDGSVVSTTGVHQGDPLGPLLFSLTLQPVLESTNTQYLFNT